MPNITFAPGAGRSGARVRHRRLHHSWARQSGQTVPVLAEPPATSTPLFVRNACEKALIPRRNSSTLVRQG